MSFTKTTYSKYRAVKTVVDGITFDSKRESLRYQELKLLEKSGEIKDLQLQVPFILFEKDEWARQIKYVADFTYIEDGKFVVEDCKGMKTDVYRLKKNLMAHIHHIKIKES